MLGAGNTTLILRSFLILGLFANALSEECGYKNTIRCSQINTDNVKSQNICYKKNSDTTWNANITCTPPIRLVCCINVWHYGSCEGKNIQETVELSSDLCEAIYNITTSTDTTDTGGELTTVAIVIIIIATTLLVAISIIIAVAIIVFRNRRKQQNVSHLRHPTDINSISAAHSRPTVETIPAPNMHLSATLSVAGTLDRTSSADYTYIDNIIDESVQGEYNHIPIPMKRLVDNTYSQLSSTAGSSSTRMKDGPNDLYSHTTHKIFQINKRKNTNCSDVDYDTSNIRNMPLNNPSSKENIDQYDDSMYMNDHTTNKLRRNVKQDEEYANVNRL